PSNDPPPAGIDCFLHGIVFSDPVGQEPSLEQAFIELVVDLRFGYNAAPDSEDAVPIADHGGADRDIEGGLIVVHPADCSAVDVSRAGFEFGDLFHCGDLGSARNRPTGKELAE